MKTLPLIPLLIGLAGTAGAQQQFAVDPYFDLIRLPSRPAAMVLADVDGDGHPDLIIANSSGQNQLLLGDGHGSFRDASSRLPSRNDRSLAVVAGDIDGDQDIDLIFGNVYEQNRLLLNNQGSFSDATASALPTRSDGTQALVLADVTGDGHLDLIVGNQNSANLLLRNDGKGVFSDTTNTMPADADNTQALLALDVDGDLDLDLVVGNDRNGNHLLRNNGSGVFTRASSNDFPPGGDATFGLAAGDVDGDRRPDVLFANGLGTNRLYRNLGGGRFADATAQFPTNNNANFAASLGDVDEDGDLDVVWATSFGQDELWLNDGQGRFADASARLPQFSNATSSVLLADVDQDGDPDLIAGDQSGPTVYANHLRQLSASGSLAIGQTWTLDLHWRPGFATVGAIAITGASPLPRIQAVRIPGLGNLLIDASAMVILPQIGIPTSSPAVRLPLSLPNNPSLQNQRVSLQSVFADATGPGDAALGNAITGVIR